MSTLVFELYASLERLAGTRELHIAWPAHAVTVADAVAALSAERPDLARAVERCACVAGDTIVRRADALPADGRLALLPPVAGG